MRTHPTQEALHIPLESVGASVNLLLAEMFPDFVKMGLENPIVVGEVTTKTGEIADEEAVHLVPRTIEELSECPEGLLLIHDVDQEHSCNITHSLEGGEREERNLFGEICGDCERSRHLLSAHIEHSHKRPMQFAYRLLMYRTNA